MMAIGAAFGSHSKSTCRVGSGGQNIQGREMSTKRSLNSGWLTNALPQQELSAALENLGFASADYREARQAFREGRPLLFVTSAIDATSSDRPSPAASRIA